MQTSSSLTMTLGIIDICTPLGYRTWHVVPSVWTFTKTKSSAWPPQSVNMPNGTIPSWSTRPSTKMSWATSITWLVPLTAMCGVKPIGVMEHCVAATSSVNQAAVEHLSHSRMKDVCQCLEITVQVVTRQGRAILIHSIRILTTPTRCWNHLRRNSLRQSWKSPRLC